MYMERKRPCFLGVITCMLLIGCDALTDVEAADSLGIESPQETT